MKDQNGQVILESNVNNTITFTGRRYDSESGLYFYRNRMYSAELGRFISKDPKGYIDGMNLYAYVKNNPLKYLDAMGTTAYDNNSFFDSFSQYATQIYDNTVESTLDYMRDLITTDYSYTFGTGGQSSVNYGMSDAAATGTFFSIELKNAVLTTTSGYYSNAEHGAGANATGASASGGVEFFISNGNYQDALNGKYWNNGGSITVPFSLGIDLGTTFPNETEEATQTFSFNFDVSTPKIEGHSRIGIGKTWGEETKTYDFKDDIRKVLKILGAY